MLNEKRLSPRERFRSGFSKQAGAGPGGVAGVGFFPVAAVLVTATPTPRPSWPETRRVAAFATAAFPRRNRWRFDTEPQSAHMHLLDLFETQRADFAYLRSGIADAIVGIRGADDEVAK